ncbi:MAG TPA: hypothetical protein VLI90_06780 [Tepidisphaeraceae bacterium]|nr:hypothetical protein [Tepidisphaeraceae bacterium]
MANLHTHPTAKLTQLAALAITTLLLVAAGCHSNPNQKIAHGEEFSDEKAATSVGQMAQAQTAAGAKNDGMLYDHNFHGTKLNSLGQTKLDLIVKGTPAGDPVVVYLNVPQDGLAARRPAVLAYLHDGGLKDAQIKLIDGPATGENTPSAKTMSKIYMAKDGSYTGEMAEDQAAGSAGGMGQPSSGGSPSASH